MGDITTEKWWGKHYSFFCNRECEFFPCHKTEDPEQFNCLFCYCPLYPLGAECGGTCTFLPNGIKDCSHCTFPHQRENYGTIVAQFQRIVDTYRK